MRLSKTLATRNENDFLWTSKICLYTHYIGDVNYKNFVEFMLIMIEQNKYNILATVGGCSLYSKIKNRSMYKRHVIK